MAKERPESLPLPPRDAGQLAAHRAKGTLWTEVVKEQESHILPLACLHMKRAEKQPAVTVQTAEEYLSLSHPHAPGSETVMMSSGGYDDGVLELVDDEGRWLLFIAAREGHEAVVGALLAAGAAVDKAANEGATPLYIAA